MREREGGDLVGHTSHTPFPFIAASLYLGRDCHSPTWEHATWSMTYLPIGDPSAMAPSGPALECAPQ